MTATPEAPLDFFMTGFGGPLGFFFVIGTAAGGGPFAFDFLGSSSTSRIYTFSFFWSLALLTMLRLVTDSVFFYFLYCIFRLLLSPLNYPDRTLSSSSLFYLPSRVPNSSVATVGLDG
jgi:hypothetical protein